MTTKSLIIESIQTPEEKGYLDKIVILDEGGILYHGPCSCCPDSATDAWIAPTLGKAIDWKCIISPNHGNKRLIFNDGGAVLTRFPNPKHQNRNVAFSVELHKGGIYKRGSAGCITYPPDIADMIDFFEIGETGKLEIVDYSNMRKRALA
jgi:hypothetical protein